MKHPLNSVLLLSRGWTLGTIDSNADVRGSGDVAPTSKAPDCIYGVEVNAVPEASRASPAVQCKCGFAYCFACGIEDHTPVPCPMHKMWTELTGGSADGAEQAFLNWKKANTQDCPKCGASIQKNDGCNSMRCKCGHEFCYICRGSHGSMHSFGKEVTACTAYTSDKDVKARVDASYAAKKASRAHLARLEHFEKRFNTHRQSHELEVKNLPERIAYYRDCLMSREYAHGLPPSTLIETSFLDNAADVLKKCRSILRHSYCFAYFTTGDESGGKLTSDGGSAAIFEYNQGFLDAQVEKLSWTLNRINLVKVWRSHDCLLFFFFFFHFFFVFWERASFKAGASLLSIPNDMGVVLINGYTSRDMLQPCYSMCADETSTIPMSSCVEGIPRVGPYTSTLLWKQCRRTAPQL